MNPDAAKAVRARLAELSVFGGGGTPEVAAGSRVHPELRPGERLEGPTAVYGVTDEDEDDVLGDSSVVMAVVEVVVVAHDYASMRGAAAAVAEAMTAGGEGGEGVWGGQKVQLCTLAEGSNGDEDLLMHGANQELQYHTKAMRFDLVMDK